MQIQPQIGEIASIDLKIHGYSEGPRSALYSTDVSGRTIST